MTENSKAPPLISVVMSFYNGRNELPSALRSLFWQTYTNWELILLNDGSTDGVEQIVGQYRDPRIRLYGDSIRRGLPFRLNQGISLANGKYIARMDVDDIAFPDRFMRQLEYLESHPDVDLLATSAIMLDKEGRPIGLLSTRISHAAICDRPWHGFSMPHPTWMGRVEWFRNNPYNERALKAQDQELLYRTYKISIFAGLPEVLLGYHYSNLSFTKTVFGRFYYLRGIATGGNRLHLMIGLASHVLAVTRDFIGMLANLDTLVIKAKTRPVDSSLLTYWNGLRGRLIGTDNWTGER